MRPYTRALTLGAWLSLAAWPAWPAPSAPEAARFLAQATFGPDSATIADVMTLGYEGWLQQQSLAAASLHRPEVELAIALDQKLKTVQSARQEVWWRRAVTAPDQLRQRVAFALSQILVVSDQDDLLRNRPVLMAEYYDVLVRNALGNYRVLLEQATLAPAMGIYLSMLRNNRPDPASGRRADENFAREAMQLFSIGLWQLNADGSHRLDGEGRRVPAYSQETVEHFARAYTGWGWADGATFHTAGNSHQPMKPYDNHHDMDAKTLLNGTVLPAGQGAQADLAGALDNLFAHPNVGPFLARRLIQRLVSSNPSPAYVQRVARAFDDNGSGVRGDLAAVVRAILLDSEARGAPARHGGKLREPLLRLTAVWRAFNAAAANGRYAYDHPEHDWGQAALRAPSVFNFFTPDYQAPGALTDAGLYSPEFQIQTESRGVTMVNAWTRFVRRQSGCPARPLEAAAEEIRIDLCEAAQQASEPAALVDYLDRLLLYGRMPPAMRQRLQDHLAALPADDGGVRRATEALFLVASSPQFAVQK